MKPTADICAQVQAQLPLYVGGDMGAGFADAAGVTAGDMAPGEPAAGAHVRDELARDELVRRHLEACAACKAEFERLGVACAALASLREERVGEIDVWNAVRAELGNARLLRTTEDVTTPIGALAPSSARPARTPWGSVHAFPQLKRAAAVLLAIGLAAVAWTWSRRGDAEHDNSNPTGPSSGPSSGPSFGPSSSQASDDVAIRMETAQGILPAGEHLSIAADAVRLAGVEPSRGATPAGYALGAKDVADANCLQKVDSSQGLHWFAVPFDAHSFNVQSLNPASANLRDQFAGRGTNPWQAASHPVRLDPRVR